MHSLLYGDKVVSLQNTALMQKGRRQFILSPIEVIMARSIDTVCPE